MLRQGGSRNRWEPVPSLVPVGGSRPAYYVGGGTTRNRVVPKQTRRTAHDRRDGLTQRLAEALNSQGVVRELLALYSVGRVGEIEDDEEPDT